MLMTELYDNRMRNNFKLAINIIYSYLPVIINRVNSERYFIFYDINYATLATSMSFWQVREREKT